MMIDDSPALTLADLERRARQAHEMLGRVVARLKPGQVRPGIIASFDDLRAAQADVAAVLGWVANGAPAAPRRGPVR